MVFLSLLAEIGRDFMSDYKKKQYPISDDERNLLKNLLYAKRPSLVIDAFSIEMTTTLLQCLRDGEWLNDEVINFYMAMLQGKGTSTTATLLTIE
jgi:Ulp1 family protease